MRNLLSRIPLDEYYALTDAVNYSTAKWVLKSPRHFRHVADHGTDRTECMLQGTATHAAILEPDKFASDFVVWNVLTKNGSGKVAPRTGSAWDHFQRCNPDKTIITEKQHALAVAMHDAVWADDTARPFLAGKGEAEVALVWTDPETGLVCKGRVDRLTDINGEPTIVGIKTAIESGADAMSKQSNRLHYHMQWAMYREGYRVITGQIPRMIEIVVESKAPHDPVTYEITEGVIQPGLNIYREALDEIARCTATGKWPGQGGGEIVSLTLPTWAAGIPEDVGFDMTGIEGTEA